MDRSASDRDLSPLGEISGRAGAHDGGRSLAALYRSLLMCARDQAAALAADDLDLFDALATERGALMAGAGRFLASQELAPAERSGLCDLLQAVMAQDAENAQVLAAAQVKTQGEAAALRRERTLAARYRPVGPSMPEGSLVDDRW